MVLATSMGSGWNEQTQGLWWNDTGGARGGLWWTGVGGLAWSS